MLWKNEPQVSVSTAFSVLPILSNVTNETKEKQSCRSTNAKGSQITCWYSDNSQENTVKFSLVPNINVVLQPMGWFKTSTHGNQLWPQIQLVTLWPWRWNLPTGHHSLRWHVLSFGLCNNRHLMLNLVRNNTIISNFLFSWAKVAIL